MQENSTYIDSYVNVLSEIVLKSPKKTYRQILSLTKIIEKNSAVNFFFENKWFSVNEKKKRLTEIFSKYFDKELIAFLKVIIDDGKWHKLKKYLFMCQKMLEKKIGVEEITIHTAFALNQKQMKKIEEIFGNYCNKKIRSILKLDKELIGGIKVICDGKYFDFSILNKVNSIKDEMLKKI